MSERDLSLDDLDELAAREMSDKEEELGNAEQTRELYDVPTEPAVDLARQQLDEEETPASGG